ncbi:MAG: NADH-quinone oxidoreductase subunit NuoE [Planctomycetota bacterium]
MKSCEKINIRTINKILSKHPADDDSLLIPLLQEAQAAYGFLPRQVLEKIAQHTKVPISKVYGVATFYSQFYLTQRGKHFVRCCRGTACHVRGASRVIETVENELKIKDGETTPDYNYTMETVACFGTCFLAPVMMIDSNYYGNLTPQRVTDILESHKKET